MNKLSQKNLWYLAAVFLIVVLYLFTHLWHLLELPVFADEAIYIRWSQLIIDDWRRYLFFPLNDGKTPLFMWLLVPFQFLFSDQLYAARFASVLIGLGQIAATIWSIRLLGGGKLSRLLGALFVTILPYWFFHYRMALIEATLNFFLTLSLAGFLELSTNSPLFRKPSIFKLKKIITVSLKEPWLLFAGGCFGLALWTKVPAILFAPTFILLAFIPRRKSIIERLIIFMQALSTIAIGLVLFIFLKTQPVFSQLFSRGGDFLYPWREVLFGGEWQQTIINIPTYFAYFWQYLTPAIILLLLVGFFIKRQRRTTLVLLAGALSFALPIALLGRVVYPRYFVPAIITLTIAASLVLERLFSLAQNSNQSLPKKTLLAVTAVLLLVNAVSTSAKFIVPALVNADTIPFVSADITQYLTEWSSGHGIKEVVDLIQNKSQHSTIAVATEGFFGTLPDGILMYLHRRDVSNIMIQGIGQPVSGTPDKFNKQAADYKTVWLVVNSHRLRMDMSGKTLVAQFCRPYNAPCLQVWQLR